MKDIRKILMAGGIVIALFIGFLAVAFTVFMLFAPEKTRREVLEKVDQETTHMRDYFETRQYKAMAEEGDTRAMHMLGRRYIAGLGIKEDRKKGFEWITKAAEKGNVFSMHTIGQAYLHGDTIERNVEKALYWLTKAVDNGCERSMYELGLAYLYDEGLEKDPEKARKLFEEVASKRSPYRHFYATECSMYELGKMYARGDFGEKDIEKAEEWFLEFVKDTKDGNGGLDAILTIARMYGGLSLTFNVGQVYTSGNGGEKDLRKAREWYTKAYATVKAIGSGPYWINQIDEELKKIDEEIAKEEEK